VRWRERRGSSAGHAGRWRRTSGAGATNVQTDASGGSSKLDCLLPPRASEDLGRLRASAHRPSIGALPAQALTWRVWTCAPRLAGSPAHGSAAPRSGCRGGRARRAGLGLRAGRGLPCCSWQGLPAAPLLPLPASPDQAAPSMDGPQGPAAAAATAVVAARPRAAAAVVAAAATRALR
jgi:hypothetical protein